MVIAPDKIKQLREETGAGVMALVSKLRTEIAEFSTNYDEYAQAKIGRAHV